MVYRKRRGLSQSDLANMTGISKSNISAYENHRREPSTTTLERLAKGAGLRVLLLDVGRGAPVAEHVKVLATALGRGDVDYAFATLLTISLDLTHTSPSVRVVLSYQAPPSIDAEWDAAVAGVVEWRLAEAGAPIPDWVTACERDATKPWAPPMAVQFEDAETSDVEALSRRGIRIHSVDLELD